MVIARVTLTYIMCRLSRLERDVAQKRILLDELRLKLKLAKETSNENLQMLESKTEEMSRVKSASDQNKTTVSYAAALRKCANTRALVQLV